MRMLVYHVIQEEETLVQTQSTGSIVQRSERTRAIRVIKYLLFSASIVPALVAGAMSYPTAGFSWLWFVLSGLVLLIGQAGADYLYYYYTHFHTDARDAHTKIFSGWRPLFTDRWIKPEQTRLAGIICLAVDVLIGIYFFLQLGPVVILMALAGGFVAVFFTPLMLRGWKEPVIFVTFGPLCVISMYYILAQRVDLGAVIISLPVGLLVTLVAYYKGARYEVREENGEPMVLNMNRKTVTWLLALAYGILAAAGVAGLIERWAMLGLLTIPLAFALYRRTSGKSKITDYLWATVYSLAVLIVTGLLIAAGYLIAAAL